MLQKTLSIFIALSLLLLLAPENVSAKRLLLQAKPAIGKSTKATASPTRGVKISVKFKSGKSGIIATFSDLGIASKVSYSLTYTSRGVQEGAGGTLTDLSATQTRELLFATCSGGVCRYHTGLKNARFVVTTILKNGKKVSKGFRLKV